MPSADRSSESGRVRRLLGRALIVTGAVAAGTGAVWAIGADRPAHASSQESTQDQPTQEQLLPDVPRDVGGLLDPAAGSGTQDAAQRASARSQGAPPQQDPQHDGPESSPLRDLDPAALLQIHGHPEKDVHRNVNHDDVRDESARQPAVQKTPRSADRGRSTSDGQSRTGAQSTAGQSTARSTDPRPRAAGVESAEARDADVLGPVQETVRGQVLAPVTAPVNHALDDVTHVVRPVLQPVAQVGERPEQLPASLGQGLTELGRPLLTDGPAPPAPAPAAQPVARAATPAPSTAVAEHPTAHPRVGRTAAHSGKAPAAQPLPKHHDDHHKADDHHFDAAVPGAPAPTPGPALGGHLPGDLGLDWCSAVPHPRLHSLGVLGHPRDDAASGTCGSQPGTTPD
jgi:hypothetical protein